MLHKRLKQLRNNTDYKQEEIANKIGVMRQTYAGYEKGRRKPDLYTLVKLANFYNVTTDYLLGRTDYPNMRIVKSKELEEFLPKEVADEVASGERIRIEINNEELTGEQKQKIIEELKKHGII